MSPKYRLSDSESESEADAPAVPSNKRLEQGLRDEVAAIFKSGNTEELTVKRVRLAVEKRLGLGEGFFKSTSDWKTRSDEIIKEEVVRPLQPSGDSCRKQLLTGDIGHIGGTRQRATRSRSRTSSGITVTPTTA